MGGIVPTFCVVAVFCLVWTTPSIDGASTTWPGSFPPDHTICNPDEYNFANFPYHPMEHFSARMEANFGHVAKSWDAHELYDGHRGNIRHYFRMWSDTLETQFNYNFHDQEIDEVVETQTGEILCKTSIMGSPESSVAGIFGFNASSSDKTKFDIFSLAGVLRMAMDYNFKEENPAPMLMRGIPVRPFETCMPMERQKGTMKVTFYFTDPTQWETADDEQGLEVPVMIEVHGTGEFGENDAVRNIDNFYDITDFFDYKPWDSEFSPPPNVYCPGRKYHGDSGNQWEPSSYFKQRSEILYWNKDETKMHMAERDEYFDYQAKCVRYGFVRVVNENDRRNMEVIHDINTGHSYVTDLSRGTCEIKELKPNGIDVSIDEHGHLQMITPADLLQGYQDYSYQGRHFERAIESYVHTAVRSFATENLTVSVWTTSRRVTDEAETEVGRPVPVKFAITPLNKQTSAFKPFEVNVFEYDDMSPDFQAWDIHHCYNDTARQWLRFIVDGRDPAWDLNEFAHLFKYMILFHVSEKADVVPIRVHAPWFDTNGMDPHRILIGFGLYERPEQPGAVDMNTYPHATLKEAWENLRKEVDSGKFNVTVPVMEEGKPSFKHLFAIPGSLKSAEDLINGKKSEDTSGYGSGDMAAIGICMLLIGIGGVVGFVFWLHKK